MKILVTGASGFIGGRLARQALERGYDVRITGRRGEAMEHLVRRGAHCIPGDLADPELARRLCLGIETVIHCAGAVSPWATLQELSRDNVQATENLVEGCLKEQVQRLVHLSSAQLYRTGASRHAIQEEQLPKRMRGSFAATRLLAEQKVRGAEEFGLQTAILRPSLVVGAGDATLFPRLLTLHRKRRLTVIGDGLNRVDFTSVHNLCDALLAAVEAAPAAMGKTYNISNGQPMPYWDVVNYALRRLHAPKVERYRALAPAKAAAALAELCCRAWPGRPRPRMTRQDLEIMNKEFILDIARARHYLDYEPRVSLWSALDEFCHWWTLQQDVGR